MSKAIYDAESTVLLKADGSAAITATASTVVDVDVSMGGTFAVAINVEAFDVANADETYVFSVVGQDSAGSNDVTLATLGAIAETGEHLVLIDAETAVKLAGASTKKLKLTATLAGTTPSLTYSAWVTRVVGAGRP